MTASTKTSTGELENLQTAALQTSQMALFDQVTSEIQHRAQLGDDGGMPAPLNWLVTGAKRTYLYHCPLCRKTTACYRVQILDKCRERGFCTDCKSSNFYRLRCHIAWIEQRVEEPDGTPGGSIRTKALMVPESQRALYRRLYAARAASLAAARAALAAAEQQLGAVGGAA